MCSGTYRLAWSCSTRLVNSLAPPLEPVQRPLLRPSASRGRRCQLETVHLTSVLNDSVVATTKRIGDEAREGLTWVHGA